MKKNKKKIKTPEKIQRRNVYYYLCKGCGKKRQSLIYSRADGGLCTVCRRYQVPENQRSLL